ncbi:MAG TPA: hypothetical protein VI566_10860 [Xanthomonadales bacterium]|nr:hypothetical protein [Xanthomonadales bacterium]
MVTPGRAPQPFVCHGIALLAGLVLLAAVSLLALVATASMVLQIRMAANFSDGQQARLAAAAAVLQGESFIFGLDHDQRLPGCADECFLPPLNHLIHYPAEVAAFPEYQDSGWWSSWSTEVGTDPLSGNSNTTGWNLGSQAPRYLIEEIHFEDAVNLPELPGAKPVNGVAYYRVLGRGQGQGPAAVAVSESIIARPWSNESPADSGTPQQQEFCAAFSPWYDCGRMAWRQRR